jgi:hypothetical protein
MYLIGEIKLKFVLFMKPVKPSLYV